MATFTAAATTTVVAVEEEAERHEDVSVARVLVNLDTATRAEAELVCTTIIDELRAAVEAEGCDLREKIKEVLLIAFKKRNHKKSMAEGEGPGEKKIFVETLLAVSAMEAYNDLLLSVLPLVPLYGSWRDVVTLAEHLVMSAPSGTELHPVALAACEIIAKQMVNDSRNSEATPSNACKYCPHSGRHGGSKKVRPNHKVDPAAAKARVANDVLASTIARLACPEEAVAGRASAALRRLRAGLNARLTEQGHLVESLLCKRQLVEVRFERANKAALLKNAKAIKKDPLAAANWAQAMKTSAKAIPDMDNLLSAIVLWEEERQSADSEVRVFPLQAQKAVATLAQATQTLLRKAKALLVAKGDMSEEEVDAELRALPPTIVVLDSAGNAHPQQCLALLLAGWLLVRSMGHNHFVFDGTVVDVTGVSVDTLARLCPPTPAEGQRTTPRLRRSLEEAAQLAANLGVNEMNVLLLVKLVADAKALGEIVEARRQVHEGPRLRSLRVHRMDFVQSADGLENVTFHPRSRAEVLDPQQARADLLFVMDFTGSMGAYMDALKTNVLELVSELASSTRLRHVNVGLVGYRDFGDTGRVVTVPFHRHGDLSALQATIEREEPSGGCDEPEDLLSALVAAGGLRWTAEARVLVVITDADAHGCNPRVMDNHPTGRCPDQRAAGYPSLAEATRVLAVNQQVDMLFCQLNTNAVCTQRALNSVYEEHLEGRGFGTIAMLDGAGALRAKVLSSVSAAVLGSLAAKDVPGLQTADGVSVSSLSGSVLSFLRQSLTAMGAGVAEVETDWQRLQRELELEELHPVRMALRLPLPAHVDTLSQRAAEALYKAGLTAAALQAAGYPEPVLDAFRAYLASTLQRI